jgi:hypothetical protein
MTERIITNRELTGRLLQFGFVKIHCCFILLVWLLNACSPIEDNAIEVMAIPTPVPAQTPTIMATSNVSTAAVVLETAVPSTPINVSPTASPTARPAPITTHYSLWAILDYPEHHLTVTQTIVYVNNSTDILATLPLLIEPAHIPDIFNLQTLFGDGGTPLVYQWENNHLVINLSPPLLPNDYFILHLAYTLAIPARQSDLGYTSRQINLGNWYPMIPPYTHERGWIINQPAHVGEHLAYGRANYDVYLKIVPENPMLVVAASGTPLTSNAWQHFRQTNARNFSWSVGYYDTISTNRNGVQISGHAFPTDAVAAQAAFEATVQAIAFFSDLFGPYPHDVLTLIEADFQDGMEFDGLYFLDQELYQRYNGSPREYLIPIAVHETAHQWWQGIVGNDQAREPWLDEALATYSELLFYEHYYPELVSWWWQFRINRFEPTGWVNSTIYDFDRFRPYVNAVYLRGALLLHELRQQAGDDAFFIFLQKYAQAGWQKEQLTETDFWAIWRQTTQSEIQPVRSQYFSE